MDLHSRHELSIDRMYSQEQILRYITFARQFKPQVGKVIMPYDNFRESLKSNIYVYYSISLGSSRNVGKVLQGVEN